MERETEPSWHDLKGPNGKIAGIVWVGLLLSVFQQFVGINVIFYYSNVLWEAVGFREDQAFVITVIGATINILTTLIAIASIDRFGRKPLLIIGSIGMTITLGTMAFIFGTATVVNGNPVLSGAQGPIALIAANLFVVAFGMSWGPVTWGAAGGDLPQPDAGRRRCRSRQAGNGCPTDHHRHVPRSQGRVVGSRVRPLRRIALLSFFFVARFISETKGKALEDMEATVRH